MATYRSDAAAPSWVPYDRPEGAQIGQEFSLPISAAVANGDVFILGKLPPGSTLLALDVQVPILDTGTAVLTTNLGTDADPARFANNGAATFHNAAVRINSYLPANTVVGTISRGTLAASLPAVFENGGDIRLTVTTAANAAATSGTIKGFYTYTMRPAFGQPTLL